jgi:DNA-binding MarR family transcriptional regulator
MFALDTTICSCRIFHVTETVDGRPTAAAPAVPATSPLPTVGIDARSPADGNPAALAKAGIIADFHTAMGELKCLGSERLVRLGISMSQLHVMHLLERHGEMAMSRLAEMIDVSVSNATGLIDRVEERGYVERIRVPSDRRIVLVRITDTGRAVLHELEAGREQILERILDELDPAQLSRLAAALSDLRSALTASTADHADAHHSHQPQGRD